MLQYLVIILDDTSISYCNYSNNKRKRNLITIDNLKEGILFAMKENLSIQFVYPNYVLPDNYKAVIETIDHTNTISVLCEDIKLRETADVLVFEDWGAFGNYTYNGNDVCVLKTTKSQLFFQYRSITKVLKQINRLNVVITDIDKFTDSDISYYTKILEDLSSDILSMYVMGHMVQLNILTDRLMLDSMNNCDAGVSNITLAPDGNFYICPAFYYPGENEDYGLGKAKVSVGSLKEGLNIKNSQLYRLDHAPICRCCDAFQCKRCVWLNRKMTYEVNTPSHEQCVVAHIERNASRKLAIEINRKCNKIFAEIKDIDYLDPFEKLNKI